MYGKSFENNIFAKIWPIAFAAFLWTLIMIWIYAYKRKDLMIR